MKVRRMRIRFEDPQIAPDQAQAIARRVSNLVTGERADADQIEATDRSGPDGELARHVAGRVSAALRAAGE